MANTVKRECPTCKGGKERRMVVKTGKIIKCPTCNGRTYIIIRKTPNS